MAKGIKFGVSSSSRNSKKGYIEVGGVARKIKKAYVGVDGISRLAWSGGEFKVVRTVSGTLASGLSFSNSGSIPYKTINSNLLEIFWGISPNNRRTMIYNIQQNTLTDTGKVFEGIPISHNAMVSNDGYIYTLPNLIRNGFSIKNNQSSGASVLSRTYPQDDWSSSVYSTKHYLDIDSSYMVIFLFVISTTDRVIVYRLNKNTLELSPLNIGWNVSGNSKQIRTLQHEYGDYVFIQNPSKSNISCYKYDRTNQTFSYVKVWYIDTLVSSNLTSIFQMGEQVFLSVGQTSQTVRTVYLLDMNTFTLTMFSDQTLTPLAYGDVMLSNESDTIITTYDSNTTPNFVKIIFD